MINKYKHPVPFYTLSTVIPWTFWFVAGYISHITPFEEINMDIAIVLGLIGLISPMIVAFLLIYKESSLHGDLFNRFFNFKSVKPIYLILAALIMLTSILLAQAISILFGYSPSQFAITGHFTFSSGVFPVWFLLILAPVLEELAWHSYGTDSLRNRFNLFITSLIFGAYWAIWHVPLSFIKDYYQSNLVETGWIYGVNFMISIIPYVLIMNWLYYKTNRNILVAIVFHITAGYFNEIFATHPDSKIIQTVLLCVLATIIVIREKDFFFKKDQVVQLSF
ncbi:MAG: CPBP family intramembrane metalloprotease [Bacteroidales bacterium]|nr:CPBP family intramembrane metalloprotease [Bacteroidales bacterium]